MLNAKNASSAKHWLYFITSVFALQPSLLILCCPTCSHLFLSPVPSDDSGSSVTQLWRLKSVSLRIPSAPLLPTLPSLTSMPLSPSSRPQIKLFQNYFGVLIYNLRLHLAHSFGSPWVIVPSQSSWYTIGTWTIMLEALNINSYSDNFKKYQKTLMVNIWLFLNCFESTERELFEKKLEINEFISL